MDMWKPFRLATQAYAPQAAILFDKFHIMRHLREAMDTVRTSEYARISGGGGPGKFDLITSPKADAGRRPCVGETNVQAGYPWRVHCAPHSALVSAGRCRPDGVTFRRRTEAGAR
jgi:hypothetical protein